MFHTKGWGHLMQMPVRVAHRCELFAVAVSWRLVLGLALTFAFAAGFASPAAAQGFFQQLFQQQPRTTYQQNQGWGWGWGWGQQQQQGWGQQGEYRSAPRVIRRAPKIVHPVEKKPETPAVPPSFFVAVMGDSLGQMLSQGLTEAFADRPEVAISRKARENSGLVRSDFYDWVKGSQDLLASGEKINVAVMLIGSNDHQAMRDGTASYEPHAPKWDEIYVARIEAIASQFRDKKIPMIWVGLPIMKSDRSSKDALALNEMYKEHASKAGAIYVDVWEAFGDDHGAYAASGPDVEGQVVRLRAADGIHFTKAGARKLAHFVEDEIKKVLDATEPEDGSQFAKLSPTPQGTNVPQPPADAVPAPKPPIGPVLSLTGVPLSPGGALVTRASTGTGRPLQGSDDSVQPGRADDFNWPQK
jgi:uncharacterized protein